MTKLVIEDGEAYFLNHVNYVAFLEDRAAGGQTCITKFEGARIGTVDADVSGIAKHAALALLVKAEAELREEEQAESAHQARKQAFA